MTFYKKFNENPLENKGDYQRLVNDLFEPLIPYFNKSKTDVDFHDGGANFTMKSSYLEGFARPLWGIIPLVMGGGEFHHWDIYHEGITNGTDPNHPDFWGDTGDIHQHSVEFAAFGVMLALIPEQSYEPLSAEAKNNLAVWLAKMQHMQMPQNNWLFFTVLVQDGLRTIGREDLVDNDVYMAHLEKLKNWYLGDGWYGDGVPKTVDHYGGFAMHLYGLIYARIEKNKGNSHSELFIERANNFAQKFKYWFADSGETLAQGRSLTYRFACGGFWGGLAISDSNKNPTLNMGQIKFLWGNHVKSWQNKPIFTNDGLLTRGYFYPDLVMCESYNSPTSPYWAMKAFLPLMLPDNHPFWTEKAEEVEYEKDIYPMPENNTIVQRVNGHSIVHYGSPIHEWLQLDKYNKFAYSTNFGFEMNSLQYANVNTFGDNILAFSFDQGDNWQMRMRNLKTTVDGSIMTSHWQSGNQEITTTIQVLKNGMCIRTHDFILEQDAIFVETGFSIDQWYQEAVDLYTTDLKSTNQVVDIASSTQNSPLKGNMVTIKGINGISIIKSLDDHEKEAISSELVHSNVISPRTKLPALKTHLPKGTHKLKSLFLANPNPNTNIDKIFTI